MIPHLDFQAEAAPPAQDRAYEAAPVAAMPPAYDRVVCPVCDGTEFDELATAPRAVRCRACGLGIEARVRLPINAYRPDVYDAARDRGTGQDRWARFHHDSAVAADRLDQLKPLLPKTPVAATGRPLVWVDVGCNSGAFLVVARRRGWEVVGVEADPAAAAQVGPAVGVQVLTPDVWAAYARQPAGTKTHPAPPKPFAVSLWDVLEHLLDPVHAFVTAAAALEPGGLLVLDVPDLDQAGDLATWKHRRVTETFTEHLYHFSRASLEALASRFTPDLRPVRFTTPVPGKLQAVFRKIEPGVG